jgi:hypothetical protein
MAVELPVVTFAEARVELDGNRRPAERDLGGLDCPPQVGGVDDARVRPPLAERSCLPAA